MKKIITILLFCLMIFSFIGCSSAKVNDDNMTESVPEEISERFYLVDSYMFSGSRSRHYIIADRETNIEYLYIYDHNGATITVLYDNNGMPKIHKDTE